MKGYFTLVLHSHLPFVHHVESNEFIEERWIYEALTESYLPLIIVFDKLIRDKIPFKVVMSFSSTLLTMLSNQQVQLRFNDHLDNLLKLCKSEIDRTKADKKLHKLAKHYLHHFENLKRTFNEEYEGNIINALKRFIALGHLEMITSSATHAFLPYIKTEQALKAQIENAVLLHQSVIGERPKGIWLPECGYDERIDSILIENDIQYFFTDTHTMESGNPNPRHGVYSPLKTKLGIKVIGRDPLSSQQVWSSIEGYPGDYVYREYYKDIGYEMDYDYISNYLHPSGVRLNTGIKYWSITGSENKEIYQPERAKQKVREHANHFVSERIRHINELYKKNNVPPMITATYDTELFGHWWYEGPQWIDALFRSMHENNEFIQPITPNEYLNVQTQFDDVSLSFSSWGSGGYGKVWLNETNHWIYRHLHEMEERMIYVSTNSSSSTALKNRALNQAVREMLLAQSSDWAFIMDNQTVVDYAVKRTKQHIKRFHKLCDEIERNEIDETSLIELEKIDYIFPKIDYNLFANLPTGNQLNKQVPTLKVLLLSWEYPPIMVGGLSRHVYDLTRFMVKHGIEVHVITSHIDGYPSYECNQDVHIHRVKTLQSKELSFMEWVFQLNIAMVDYIEKLNKWHGEFHVIHAHDWLVGYAARHINESLNLPIVTTIHATEYGRNNGLSTELHYAIHRLEQQLIEASTKVIVCSDYMEKEIERLFLLEQGMVTVIPNGIDPNMVQVSKPDPNFKHNYAHEDEKIVFFVGRLVQEKGVQTLLDSVPMILEHFPKAKFVIAGKGPMLQELMTLCEEKGIKDKVLFSGFINDDTRNQLFQISSVAVFPSYYEPFGIVALEAMASGVPVVVSGVGGLLEIVNHGVDGYTVLPGHASSLAEHIIRVLQNSYDIDRMTENALFKVYTTYSWEQIATRTIDVYMQATLSDSSYSLIASSKE